MSVLTADALTTCSNILLHVHAFDVDVAVVGTNFASHHVDGSRLTSAVGSEKCYSSVSVGGREKAENRTYQVALPSPS
jgi:hypothetical protein